MAPDAFDDQYEGCVEEMEKKAPELLMKDFNMSRQLKLEWERAGQKWEKIKTRMSYPKGFHDFHGTALVAYTGDIHKDFNGAVREFKKNPSNFHYRAFHYYLTRALQLLSNQNCYSVYRGTKDRFHYSGKGSVRFGQFASSSLEKKVALKNFSGAAGTLYTINTCLGVYIKAFSYFPREEEVLIPAYEVYHKVSVTRSGEGYDKISLDSPRREKSNFNCFYSGSTETGNSHLNSSGESASVRGGAGGGHHEMEVGGLPTRRRWQTMRTVRVPTRMKVALVRPRVTYLSDGVSENVEHSEGWQDKAIAVSSPVRSEQCFQWYSSILSRRSSPVAGRLCGCISIFLVAWVLPLSLDHISISASKNTINFSLVITFQDTVQVSLS